MEVAVSSLEKQKGLELVFRTISLEILLKLFLLKYDINWPNFINTLCVYFLSYSVKCISCFMLRSLMTS